jgi:hypothetical protein
VTGVISDLIDKLFNREEELQMKEKAARDKASQKENVMGFQAKEDECIWMKARVVDFRQCDNAYDCYECTFDKEMKKVMGLEASGRSEPERPGWVEYLQKNYHGASRPCRHALTGRTSAPKICTMNYECYHCAYDQMLDDFAGLTDAPRYGVSDFVSTASIS